MSALVAMFLQLVVAPVIAIFGIVPNFVLVATVIIALHNGPVRSTIAGFILGLFIDLFALGPIGAMTLVLTLLSYAVSSLNKGSFTGGIAMNMIIMLVALALGEFFVSIIYSIVGANPDFLFSLLLPVLPSIVYDAVIGCIFLLIYNAVVGVKPPRSGLGGGRSLSRKLNR